MFKPIDTLLQRIEALEKEVQKLKDDQIKQNRDYKDAMYNLDGDNIPALQGVVKKVNLIISEGGTVSAQFVMEVVNNESNAKIMADRIELNGKTISLIAKGANESTGKFVIDTINGESNAQILAKKINLKGLQINLDADNITISSENFTVDEDGNVTLAGILTSKAGSKLGPWIFGEDSISGIKAGTTSYLVRNPADPDNKASVMYVTVGEFILDSTRIGVVTTVEWSENEESIVGPSAWTIDELNSYLNTGIVYRWTKGWSHTITWERLAALGKGSTDISQASVVSAL